MKIKNSIFEISMSNHFAIWQHLIELLQSKSLKSLINSLIKSGPSLIKIAINVDKLNQ